MNIAVIYWESIICDTHDHRSAVSVKLFPAAYKLYLHLKFYK